MSSDRLDISLFSLLRAELGTTVPVVRCTKATLVHLSHTLEDLVLSHKIPALLFTGFQESSHWREETERYRALAEVAQQVCIFAGAPLPPESTERQVHVTLRGDDPLRQEWFVVLLCPQFAALLCGQDRNIPTGQEATRQFDTIWSFEPAVVNRVLDLLEQVLGQYRPERLQALQEARYAFPPPAPDPALMTLFTRELIRFEEQLHRELDTAITALNAQVRWREDLTAALVFDLAAPLQGLGRALGMLKRGTGLDEMTISTTLDLAERNVTNLQELVQLVVDTNQLADGQVQLVWQPMVADELINEAIIPLQVRLAENQLTLDVQIDRAVTVIWGDGPLLQRMLQNLIGTVITLTPSGGHVTLNMRRAPNPMFVELQIRNTGQGLSAAALPRVFERYYQLQNGRHKGNGLSLYFCRLVAEAHRGTIRVDSQFGRGTTFTLNLPSQLREQDPSGEDSNFLAMSA